MSFSAAVADPHDLARLGTTRLLERLGGQVITGEEGDPLPPADLLDLLSAGELDLVVADIATPEGRASEARGGQLLRQARAEGLLGPGAATHVLILTREDGEDAVREAFRLGATGYALKSDPIEEIEAATTAVLRGERHLSNSVPRHWMEEPVVAGAAAASSADPADVESLDAGDVGALSDREREVLRLTAQGLTRKEVGRTLSISPQAAERCRQNVQEKLSLGGQVEMVRYAARSGLL
jgi:two-component system response regulator NreC